MQPCSAVTGEPVENEEPDRTNGMRFDDLHPVVADAAQEAWDAGDYPKAVKAAWNAVRDLARQRLDAPNVDGAQLMERIGDTNPRLPLTGMANDTERDMHRGVWRFLIGSAFYTRNPEAHQTDSPVEGDRVGAFERLAVLSIGARHLEAASSSVSVEDAVREASQSMFAATVASADDLVHQVPTGERPELVERLMDAVEAAAAANDGAGVNKLRFVYRRALHRLDATDRPVQVAAARCGRWVADDTTLTNGIEMLTPVTFPLLERRYQEKVAAALVDDAARGTIGRGVISGSTYPTATVYLFPALSGQHRARIVQAVRERLQGNWEPQAFGARLACQLAGDLDESETRDLADALAFAFLNDNPFDATDEFYDALDKGLPKSFTDRVRDTLQREYTRYRSGAQLVANLLQRLGAEPPPEQADETAKLTE